MTYFMPLADGYGACHPDDPLWRPLTLAARLELRKAESPWFSSEEICAWLTPVLDALQLLSNAGLVHRDVKPDNILFFNGVPCLADISLLGADTAQLTRRGTPGYLAPSWFLESSGHPDMYGVATTFYTMLTGNSPDKMGRAAFRWPPRGEASLSALERLRWLRFHRLIRRAIDDRPAERFIDFRAFALCLNQPDAVSVIDSERAAQHAGVPELHLPEGAGKNTARRKRVTRKAALHSPPPATSGGGAAHQKLSVDDAAAGAKKASFLLGSEIPWVSASMVVDALKNSGFRQFVHETGLIVFNKRMKEEDIPQGVSVALHYDPTSSAVWTYRCLRISNNETLKFDNQAFEEGLSSICGIFVSDKEWSEIHRFIHRPKNAMREARFTEEKMTFRGAYLSADCEVVFETDEASTLQHAFALSSRG
jgi:serine/threonine protein kinase